MTLLRPGILGARDEEALACLLQSLVVMAWTLLPAEAGLAVRPRVRNVGLFVPGHIFGSPPALPRLLFALLNDDVGCPNQRRLLEVG